MGGQSNFPDDQESVWYPGERGTYPEPDWRTSGDDRYPAESRHGGHGSGGDERFDDDRYSDPLGTGGFRSRYPEPGANRGVDPDRPADPGYGPAVLPVQAPPVTSATPAGHTGARGHDPASGEPAGQADPARSVSAPTGTLPPVVDPDPFSRFQPEPADRDALQRGAASGGSPGEGVYRTRRPAVAIVIALLTVLFELPALRLLLTGALADQVSVPAVVAGTLLMIGLAIFALGVHAVATGAAALADPARFWLRPPTAYLTVGLALLVTAGLAAT